MKNRVRKIANFFAFNLLFFALYLNFIHKDNIATTLSPQNAAFSGTVLVEGSEQSSETKNENIVVKQQDASEKISASNTSPLKLSIN